MACAPSENSGQPGHPPSLIRISAVRMKKAWTLWADLSLRWAHSHFVGFDVHRLKWLTVYLYPKQPRLSCSAIDWWTVFDLNYRTELFHDRKFRWQDFILKRTELWKKCVAENIWKSSANFVNQDWRNWLRSPECAEKLAESSSGTLMMDGWVRVLRPFNSILVISRRWHINEPCHEKICLRVFWLG